MPALFFAPIMRIPRIYTAQQITPHTDLSLDALATNHVVSVLRMQTGEHLFLFNGAGGHFEATITHITKKQVMVHVRDHRTSQNESPIHIHIGQGLSRSERMDYAIQKSTEMGVAEITPLFTTRSEVKLDGERSNKRQQHWQQVAISACEQCGRDVIPAINAPLSLTNFITHVKADLKLVLHHESPTNLRDLPTPTSIAVLIGSEGGLTEEEITLAVKHGFVATQLGPRVLRTETAPVAALSVLNTLWGDI
jgi:16S rRNA (uracil1498-N3)-methyltransferase